MEFHIGGAFDSSGRTPNEREKYVEVVEAVTVKEGEAFTIYKYAANISSMYFEKDQLVNVCAQEVATASKIGFDALLDEHKAAWVQNWSSQI